MKRFWPRTEQADAWKVDKVSQMARTAVDPDEQTTQPHERQKLKEIIPADDRVSWERQPARYLLESAFFVLGCAHKDKRNILQLVKVLKERPPFIEWPEVDSGMRTSM